MNEEEIKAKLSTPGGRTELLGKCEGVLEPRFKGRREIPRIGYEFAIIEKDQTPKFSDTKTVRCYDRIIFDRGTLAGTVIEMG